MIAILTATFNRAATLQRLYDSLCRQTNKEFEWHVIDDGSSDGTKHLVQMWKNEGTDFPVFYSYQKNGGKHRAVNRGVAEISAEYTFIVDSDDYLTEHALEKAYEWIGTFKQDMPRGQQEQFAGVSGCKGINEKDVIGRTCRGEYVDATNLERVKYGLTGDKAEIYRTDLLKRYPFPEFEGETFLSEGIVWDTIAWDGYRLRWFPDIIVICEYREDGLTKSQHSLYSKNMNGYTRLLRQRMNYYKSPYREFQIAEYASIAKGIGIKYRQICKNLEVSRLFLIYAIIMNRTKEVCKSFLKTVKGKRYRGEKRT